MDSTVITVILFILNFVMFTIIIINMYRISKLRNHSLLDHAETSNLSLVMKRYYRKIVADNLMPMLIDYLNTFLKDNEIESYLRKNEKKIFDVIDNVVKQNKMMSKDIVLANTDIKDFVATLDLDAILSSINEVTPEI